MNSQISPEALHGGFGTGLSICVTRSVNSSLPKIGSKTAQTIVVNRFFIVSYAYRVRLHSKQWRRIFSLHWNFGEFLHPIRWNIHREEIWRWRSKVHWSPEEDCSVELDGLDPFRRRLPEREKIRWWREFHGIELLHLHFRWKMFFENSFSQFFIFCSKNLRVQMN